MLNLSKIKNRHNGHVHITVDEGQCRNRCGLRYGSLSGHGYGYSNGSGYGDGDGSGLGYGYADGSGCGDGYGDGRGGGGKRYNAVIDILERYGPNIQTKD